MGKINLSIKYCLINKKAEYNIKGINDKDKIKFLDNDNMMILDISNNSLKRITKDEEINFDFFNQVCEILDKNTYQKFNFKINIIEYKNQYPYFFVKYNIEEETFSLEIMINEN